ncbi:uncharacterized protein PRCAT00004084001 [Priceomyces carsonii]|uniref:uncharacterized protein n=1 Tax=Priceomyces carsonii TaxID=28549 RepID=UPI002EDA5DEC|nr:unnamed protein product [Priceomyces carsonii]
MSSTAMYRRTEVLGRGKFGVVYKGVNKQTKNVVAIKVLNLDTQEDEVAEVQQEIQFLAELKHVSNVIHYHGSFLNDTRLWIIMDYCAGGSVRTLLKAGVFEEKYIAIIVRELAIALQAVHKLEVIHRDLKAANVLITNEGNVQLCDFGVAARLTSTSNKRNTMAGTPYWMAPEVIREGEEYNVKADIWSLGMTIYEITTGNPPYCDKDASWAMQMISKLTPPRLEGREYSPILKECIALCLDENPDERPLAEDLLKCRLVKMYKGHPTLLLKEVISRYLIWRDHNSRESLHQNNLDDDMQSIAESNHMQVKWDFDSLSSKEYIIENDIDIDQVDEKYSYDDDAAADTYRTFKFGNAKQGSDQANTISMHDASSPISPRIKHSEKPDIPKSLTLLFQDSEPPEELGSAGRSGVELSAPSSKFNGRVESPTIEIPDMDNLSNFSKHGPASANAVDTIHTTQPAISKPPTLYHSQSASGNLESRFISSIPATSTINSRKTKVSSNQASEAILQGPPQSPPYSQTTQNNRTPSPATQSSSSTLVSAQTNFSPSKSMKALHSHTNPLLQPINFKATDSTNISSSNPTSNTVGVQSNKSNGVHNEDSESSKGASNANSISSQPQGSTGTTGRRARPGLYIQMPTPSNGYNSLSALTNEGIEGAVKNGHNINQFGINPAQAANLTMTMTPVAEKEALSYNALQQDSNDNDGEKETRVIPTHRKTSSASVHPNLQAPKPLSPPNSTSSNSTKAKFPTIPNINGTYFSDSTPKQKLINELDTMIKLFNQGLDALVENL